VVKALLGSDRLYHIFLAGRDINKAEGAVKSSTAEIESKSTVEAIQIDVEDDDSIAKAYNAVSSKQPRIDTLINNAGECLYFLNVMS
jgi:NADP-dependent 3-hydroxy acid dehydrogenase YdfG